MSERFPNLARRVAPALIVAAALTGCSETRSAPARSITASSRYNDPAIAGPILANRISECSVRVVPGDEDSTEKGRASLHLKIDEKFNTSPSVEPYYKAFADNNGVRWLNDGIVTRAHLGKHLKPVYYPVAKMDGYSISHTTKDGEATTDDDAANGNRLDTTLHPSASSRLNSTVDIWANGSTNYDNENGKQVTTLSVTYCGQIALHTDENGTPQWQVTGQTTPLEPLVSGKTVDGDQRQTYEHQMLPAPIK